MNRNLIAWLIYGAFAVTALALHWHPQLLDFSGHTGIAKAIVWAAYLAFLVYSLHCSRNENIFRTIKTMNSLYWGRQIGIDLYIGVSLFLAFIYLHEGSVLVFALWLVPALLFVNLATLLYVAIHLESILARFFI